MIMFPVALMLISFGPFTLAWFQILSVSPPLHLLYLLIQSTFIFLQESLKVPLEVIFNSYSNR